MDQADMAQGSAEIQKEPVVLEGTWAAIKSVTKGTQFAAVFNMSADESEIGVEKTFEWTEAGNWPELESHFSKLDQDIRWAIVNLPYTTTSGGKRNKVIFITWVPDTLTRPSMRESVRMKFCGVHCGGAMRQKATIDGVAAYQANDLDDLGLWTVLAKAAKFERDGVNKDSLSKLL